MGIVYRARQLSLNRLVALKMLQAGVLATEDDLRRFQNEAEAVATLDHPHIVPILEVGQHERQRYFSMKLIGGPSLDRKLGEYTCDPKAAARLVATVTEAVHHAHQRGILHRDLKPGNVLLDERGEPHVTDFGLAKRVQGDSELTQSGAILGTPAYMAPEQASGKRGMVTTATDVYGLGALLYALLTGRAPFGGDSPAETLELVRERTPEPPSKRNPRVPRDLEIIALKCLEKEPAQRYGSAAALADDLRRYLNGESILARPVWLATRAWMWCKRNPVLARLAFVASALMLALLIGSVGLVVVDRGRRREAEDRALAETNFTLVKKALDDYFTRVSEDALLKEQDSVEMRRLRGELLKIALEYYREFLRQRGRDPQLRREHAEAQYRVGQIMREIGTADEAIASFDGSIAIWEELRAVAPGDPDVRVQLARTCLALGEQFAWIRDFPRAFTALARSREILKELVVERPGDVSCRIALAECDKELGIAEGERGEQDRGLERLVEAESILKGLLLQSPGDPGSRKRLADTINARGEIQFKNRNDAEALRAFREFQEICQSLLGDQRSRVSTVELLDALARSHYNVGAILYKHDRDRALASYQKSLDYRWTLVVATSANSFQENLAASVAEISVLQIQSGRVEQGFASIRRSIDFFERLVAVQPDKPRYHGQLGRSLNILGYLYDEALQDNVRALPVFERARDEVERGVAGVPDSDLYKFELIEILQNLGEQYADMGTPDAGLQHYRRAVLIRRQLMAARPLDRDRNLALADQLALLATVERHAGHSDEAARSYAEAVAVLEPLASEAAGADVQLRRGTFLMGAGLATADQGRTAEALQLLRRAVEILTPFGSSAKDDPKPRWRLTEALWETARLLRLTGKSDEADRLDAERLALWKDRPPSELAGLARPGDSPGRASRLRQVTH